MRTFGRYLVCVAIIMFVAHGVRAQTDTLPPPLSKVSDSTQRLANTLMQRLDSLKGPSQGTPDTVAFYRMKLDSIRGNTNQQLAQFEEHYTREVNRVNTLEARMRSQLDSLAGRNLPIDKARSTLDSLQEELSGVQRSFETRISDVKNKALKDINAIDFPPELSSEVGEIKTAIAAITPSSLPGGNALKLPLPDRIPMNIPALNGTNGLTPSLNIGNEISLPNTSLNSISSTADITQTPGVDIPGINDIPQVRELSAASSEATGSIKEIKDMKGQPLDKLADDKAGSLQEVSAVRKQAQVEGVEAIQSEEALKAALERQVRAVAIDHFSDKQAQLKAAMEKIATYKRKYGEMNSILDLKKKPENPIKKKTVLERIVPGVNLQVLKKGDDIMLDINPYLGYRLTPRLSAGAGWNERVGYDWGQKAFRTSTRIYGPRLYGEYRIGKGFSPRLEAELMKTRVPPATVTHGDPYQQRWVPGVFAGIRKDYKIAGNLHGTASVMFRLFDPKRQSPYGDIVNARFGFEYHFKQKKKNHDN